MRSECFNKKVARLAKWDLWFAWYPIYIKEPYDSCGGQWIWWEWVYRSYIIGWRKSWAVQYKIIDFEGV